MCEEMRKDQHPKAYSPSELNLKDNKLDFYSQ